MTTTTKALFATAVVAAISIPWLLPYDPPLARTVGGPAKRPLVSSGPREATPQSPTASRQPSIPVLDRTVASDQELILAEFAKLGGSIREEYVDKDINNIIRQNFGNDRAAFELDLAEKGQSLEQFKALRREMMIISVMKAKMTQGLTDPDAKKRAIDGWLAELRLAE